MKGRTADSMTPFHFEQIDKDTLGKRVKEWADPKSAIAEVSPSDYLNFQVLWKCIKDALPNIEEQNGMFIGKDAQRIIAQQRNQSESWMYVSLFLVCFCFLFCFVLG
jgi:predicted glycosyl hydrolase (DUF1957 family)